MNEWADQKTISGGDSFVERNIYDARILFWMIDDEPFLLERFDKVNFPNTTTQDSYLLFCTKGHQKQLQEVGILDETPHKIDVDVDRFVNSIERESRAQYQRGLRGEK